MYNFYITVFSTLTRDRLTYRYVGKHVERNKKKQLLYLHKIFERHSKDMWKISLDDTHIMMFCGCLKMINLMHSIKFVTITFLKYSFSVPPGSKNNWNFPRTSILNIIHSALLLHYFQSYSPNVLCEILKKWAVAYS